MRFSILVLAILILIVGGWFVLLFWSSVPDFDSTPLETQTTSETEPESEPDSAPEFKPEPESEYEPEPEPLETEEELAVRRDVLLKESELLYRGYFYEEAISLLNDDETLINYETLALESEILDTMNRLVRFDGDINDIKHIFFHALILYPEHLYPNITTPQGGYNAGFIYQRELFRLLPQLLERGYVLFDLNLVFGRDDNGNMRLNDIYLPHGKKPLVLSIDDMNYHYGVGFANRVILDEFGELATEVITPDGEKIITYDGCVHLVIDNFVKEHPEFSYRGSKGALAVTGSGATRRRQPGGGQRNIGIFGYYLDEEQDVLDAKAVSDKFKENGWSFANHSFTHNGATSRGAFWAPGSVPDLIRNDVRRWKEELEPIIGPTNLFIAPLGYLLRGESMQVIIDNGYDIYCTVARHQDTRVFDTHALMSRIEIGGYSMTWWKDTLNKYFFDVPSVMDRHRPPVPSA
jgi:hypothetical protein